MDHLSDSYDGFNEVGLNGLFMSQLQKEETFEKDESVTETFKTFKNHTLANNILKELNEYRKNEDHQFCDWTLKSSDGVEFPVHKYVLASGCTYFKCLFSTGFSETRDNGMILSNVTSNSLERILNYIYSCEIKVSTNNVRDTFESASYLLLLELQNFCIDFMKENVNSETCLCFWRFANNNNCEELVETCIEYILKNAEICLTKSFIEQLDFDEISTIIQNTKLNCSEERVFEAVIWWLEMDYENREIHSEILLNQIRFNLLSNNFMISTVFDCNLIRTSHLFSLKINEASKRKIQIDEGHFTVHNSVIPRVGAREKQFILINSANFSSFSKNQEYKKLEILEKPLRNSAKTIFKENFLLISGLGESTYNECIYYCPINNKWRYFPSMKEDRQYHGATFVNDKIYICAGENKETTEYFDLSKEKWFLGPKFSSNRSAFGICSNDNNCIYVVGGSNKLVEQLDLRQGKWYQLATAYENFSKSCFYNNSLYCMNNNKGGIFDIRQRKWIDSFCTPFSNIKKFDICIEDDKIYSYLYRHHMNSNLSYNNYFSVYKIKENEWQNHYCSEDDSSHHSSHYLHDVVIAAMYI